MKITTIITLAVLATVFFSCQDSSNLDLVTGKEKAVYFQKELEKHEVDATNIKNLMDEPEFIQAMKDYSYAQIDSMVINIAKIEDENKFYKQFSQSTLDAFDEAMMSAKKPEDYLKIIENFPRLAERTGLREETFKNQQVQN